MSRLASIAQRIISKIEDICTSVGTIFLAVLFILVVTATIARQLDSSVVFTGEISIYLLIGLIYLGLAGSLREGKHIRVELVVTSLRSSHRLALQAITDILSIPLCVIMAITTWTIFKTTYAHGTVSQSTLAFPIWISWAILFVGVCFFLLRFIIESIKSVLSLIGYHRRQ